MSEIERVDSKLAKFEVFKCEFKFRLNLQDFVEKCLGRARFCSPKTNVSISVLSNQNLEMPARYFDIFNMLFSFLVFLNLIAHNL